MKKIVISLLFLNFLFAQEKGLELLQKDKKEYIELNKKSIETKYENLKNDWIGVIDFTSSLGRSHSFSNEQNINNSNRNSKSATIGFSQSVFESGGIGFKIDYAKDKLNYDLLSWENQNAQTIYSIYNALLEIKKINHQIKQNQYRVLNKDIELIIKKVQYEAGKTDIIELNNAIMGKNLVLKELISQENLLKDQEMELSKYTDLKYNEIEILDFKLIKKEDFLDRNLYLLQESSKVDMLNSEYKRKKTEYLPKITINAKASYSNQDESFNKMFKDTSRDDASSSATINLSMPLYDYNKSTKLEESKIDVLKQRALVNDLKNEKSFDYEQSLTRLDTYFKHIKTINENIKLYDELIFATQISSGAGMTSKYDLEILENTKEINIFDLFINNINILQQYAKLYFMVKG